MGRCDWEEGRAMKRHNWDMGPDCHLESEGTLGESHGRIVSRGL